MGTSNVVGTAIRKPQNGVTCYERVTCNSGIFRDAVLEFPSHPCPQGLLGVQNGGLEKTLANRSRDLKLANHKALCRFETIKSPIFLET